MRVLGVWFHVLRSIRINNLILLGLGQFFTWYFLIGTPQAIEELLDSNIIILILSTALVAAGGYLINDYHDIKIDLINKPEEVIIGNKITKKTALVFYWIFTGMGIALVALASLRLVAVNILASVLLWFYSTNFKRHPYWGNLIVSFLGSLSIIMLPLQYGWNYPIVFWYAGLTFSMMMFREIIKDLQDIEGDEKEGYRTIPIAYGLPYTKTVLMIIGASIILQLMAFGIYLESLSIWIVFGLISATVLYSMITLPRADTKKEFGRLSFISKLVFAAGIISIIFLG